MAEKIKYSSSLCSSGLIVSFSGANLLLEEKYKVVFDTISSIPNTTKISLKPTGYYLVPSQSSPIFYTVFSANSNIADNSSTNIIGLSIYNSLDNLIYQERKSIVCGNLCGPNAVPLTPTPTPTPTVTPTNVGLLFTQTPTLTPTNTPTPSPQPVMNVSVNFDRLINLNSACNNILVRGTAYGPINKRYAYSFGTDMSGVDLKISNPSGFVTLLSNPTYIYTAITMPESCQDYSLEFGLSDGAITVQSAAIFRCGNC
jgi:hypothetical protein